MIRLTPHARQYNLSESVRFQLAKQLRFKRKVVSASYTSDLGFTPTKRRLIVSQYYDGLLVGADIYHQQAKIESAYTDGINAAMERKLQS